MKAIGEIALRVNDLATMKRFYEDVMGFDVLGEFPSAVLLRVAAGYKGHTQVLALFDRGIAVGPERTTIDHVAFTIAPDDYEHERHRLEALGLRVELKQHDWVRWRSLYFHDPEGNRVELVCYDETIGKRELT